MDHLASSYDYDLPEELIAQTPLEDRAGSRMLHLNRATGEIRHLLFRDMVQLLRPGDLLVFNNTKVTALRLYGSRPSGGQTEALIFGPVGEPGVFRALCRPARKLALGAEVLFEAGLSARVVRVEDEGFRLLDFGRDPGVMARLEEVGQTPLPPYIHQALAVPGRYQTVYASQPGSAAAPTAGLHFTPDLLKDLAAHGIARAEVTLDVGLDTFRPMSVEEASDHVMHGERCQVSPETAQAVNSCQGRVIAVGTTTVRTLESFASGPGRLEPGEQVSRIFITPGYEYRVVSGMFTNFHMPRTTMMFMVAALAGREALMKAYGEAVREGYRFLSFGDSMAVL